MGHSVSVTSIHLPKPNGGVSAGQFESYTQVVAGAVEAISYLLTRGAAVVGGPDNGGAGTEVCEEVTLLLLLLPGGGGGAWGEAFEVIRRIRNTVRRITIFLSA